MWVWYLSSLAVLVAGQGPCPLPRVRRPWSQLSPADKTLYLQAVALSMKKGYHQRFVEIHVDPASSAEAHDNVFFYWHRAFLLGYENMLRSLGSQYACLTLPFWDYPALGTTFIAGGCSNMLQCGSLLQDFGGAKPKAANGPYTLMVNGVLFQADNCVSSTMTQNFCQNSTAFAAKRCFNCVPRNDWSKVPVPPDVNVLSIYNNILGDVAPTLAGVTSGVQWGTHNMVHAVLDSVMGTLASPADPVFYAHHATTDALHAIYYNCVVASKPPQNPYTDVRTWTTTRNSGGKTIGAADPITMNVGEAGTPPASIWTATTSPIYPFFKGLPQTYAAYTDSTSIGAYSYSYNFSGTLLDGMNTQCTAFKPASASLLAGSDNEILPDATKQEATWLHEASTLASEYFADARDVSHQVQMMLCVYYNECLGGVFDYSE
ncbi:hypothetical protein ACHHYP_05379, partial [Achlya hypogyna]